MMRHLHSRIDLERMISVCVKGQHHPFLLYSFALGASSVGTIKSRKSHAASLR